MDANECGMPRLISNQYESRHVKAAATKIVIVAGPYALWTGLVADSDGELRRLKSISMFRRPAYRILTTLVALLAVAGAVGAQSLPNGSCVTTAAKQCCGPKPRTCCCGKAAQAAVCHCRGDSDEPATPALPPDGSSRVVKAAPWIGVAVSFDGNAAGPTFLLAASRSFFSPAGRSLQSLLCIWRI